MHIAKLDEKNIYQGIEEIEDDALQPHHIEVPHDCDLAAGRYMWDGHTFNLITDPQRIKTNDPDAINAIAIGLIAIHQSGTVALPDETLAWLDFHVRSNDFETAPQDKNRPETFLLVK